MKVFVDCNQLAHALDNMAEFFDQMFLVTHFTGWIAPLSASLKSNADISLKQVPIDFVVDRVSAALASLAIFVVSPEAACQNEADFLAAAAQCLALDTEKVARDCQRAQMADRTLTEFKQHGCQLQTRPPKSWRELPTSTRQRRRQRGSGKRRPHEQ
jgi:hypothetical protein